MILIQMHTRAGTNGESWALLSKAFGPGPNDRLEAWKYILEAHRVFCEYMDLMKELGEEVEVVRATGGRLDWIKILTEEMSYAGKMSYLFKCEILLSDGGFFVAEEFQINA